MHPCTRLLISARGWRSFPNLRNLRAGIQSVIDNDILALCRAVAAGVDINGVLDEPAGPSLMTTAVLYHRLGIIELLLAKGADVDILRKQTRLRSSGPAMPSTLPFLPRAQASR